MAAQGTITSADVVYMLVVAGLFPVPQQLQGFAADDVFSTEPVAPVEVLMGVDGILSGGYTPVAKRQSITLQADSGSNTIFESWAIAQDTIKDAYIATAFVTIPAIGRLYTCTRGFLTGYPPHPDARRVLQPRRFQITWGAILPAPI
jgi:hypothetical protein